MESNIALSAEGIRKYLLGELAENAWHTSLHKRHDQPKLVMAQKLVTTDHFKTARAAWGVFS